MMLGEGKARVCRGAMHTCTRNGGEAKRRDGDCSNDFSIVDDRNKTDAQWQRICKLMLGKERQECAEAQGTRV